MADIFYDTEFLDQGADHPLHLVSIGMVNEAGEKIYVVNADAPWHLIRQHPWLNSNVLPHLPGQVGPTGWLLDHHHPDVEPRHVLAARVRRFVLSHTAPRLNAWYSAHDHVVLTQLFGPMVKLPTGFPMRTHDIADDWDRAGRPALPEQTSRGHHALDDALYARELSRFLSQG